MIDLDDFKGYNDKSGHEAGNELLRNLAAALATACRDSDRVYRYGGDEFSGHPAADRSRRRPRGG